MRLLPRAGLHPLEADWCRRGAAVLRSLDALADGISGHAAGERLRRSVEGKGAFRRFKNELYQGHPELISSWHALRDARAQIRAVQWLADEGLIGEDAATQFVQDHPEPALP